MKIKIGDFLLKRLKEIGIKHIIGVPGDFNLQWLEQVRECQGIEFIGSSNELNAAYAADGYSREFGISALSLTYGVGDLGALPAVAGSHAEHVPVIVISGAPPLYAIKNNYRIHHSLGDGDLSNIRNAYEEFALDSSLITPFNAQEEIDRLIKLALLYKKPVNIQLPSNISYLEIEVEEETLGQYTPSSDSERLESASKNIIELYEKANSPYILVDMDVERLQLKEKFLSIIEKGQIPFAAMSTGKAILDESHPLYIGTYKGDDSEKKVQESIENSDFLLTVSPRFIEWNSGTYSHKLPKENLVNLAIDYCFVGEEAFEGVYIHDLLDKILFSIEKKANKNKIEKTNPLKFEIEKEKKLNQEDFWKQIQGFLQEDDLIYGETGSSSQALGEIMMPNNTRYISSQIWGAIGFMLPALFGSLLANPNRRQILFIGDGSFQVTAQELSRILYNKLNPIIFLINNSGYTIERYIMGMKAAYNNIPKWKYTELPNVLIENNKMKTFEVKTQGELEKALEETKSATHGILIEVHFEQEEAPEPLKKFGPAVANFNYGPRGPENENTSF